VLAKLVKKVDGKEVPETFEASYLIGADGGKGTLSLLIFHAHVFSTGNSLVPGTPICEQDFFDGL
jgi:hypothetical protein